VAPRGQAPAKRRRVAPGAAIDRLRRICTALPQATERPSHGEAAWFVGKGRSFATTAFHHHDDRVAFWCAAPDGAQETLVALSPARFFVPPYVGVRGWLGVYLDVPVDWDEIAELIAAAYREAAPKRLLATLETGPAAGGGTNPRRRR
jgi:hypothetical protein